MSFEDMIKKFAAANGLDLSTMTFGGGAGNLPTANQLMVNSGRKVPSPTFVNPPQGSGDRVPSIKVPMSPAMVPAAVYMAQLDNFYYGLGNQNKAQYNSIVYNLRNAGFLPPWKDGNAPSHDQVKAAYTEALTASSFNPSMSVEEFLRERTRQNYVDQQNKAATVPQSVSRTETSNTTSSDYRLTNKFDALALLNESLSNYLGRAATPKELANFRAMLNAQERANPEVTSRSSTTTTTATPDADGNVTSSSNTTRSGGNTSGGVNQRQIAKEYAQSRGDYAETTAATTGMKWFQEAISAMNNGRLI